MKKLFIFILISVLNTAIYSQVQHQWVQTYSYGGSQCNFINTDRLGNVYVVGSMTGMDAPVLTFMQAFSSEGTQLWTNFIDTPCSPVGVYLDSMYNQYIAGYYQGGWGPAFFSVYKYNSSGIRLWSIKEPITFYDRMFAMTGDKAGNTFVVRMKDSVLTLRKYNTAGSQQFSVVINDTIEPQTIALDQLGNIIICGFADSNFVFSCATIKYNSSGDKIWKRIFSPVNSFLLGYPVINLSASIDGGIFISCNTRDSAYNNLYTLLKYSSYGDMQWTSYVNFNNLNSEAYAMCLEDHADNTQNIAVTGSKATVLFNSNGNVLWGDTSSSFYDIKNDNSGNFYLTGATYSSPHDIRTIKLSSSGEKLWDITYNGTYNYNDGAYALALDNSGNVFVTGYSNSVPYFNMSMGTTVKYSQFQIDSIYSCFLPLSIGNVWVYKHYTNTPPSPDFTYRGKVKYQIVRDTLMPNGKRYFDKTYLGLTRVNPENLSVFVWDSGNEIKKDSLKSKAAGYRSHLLSCFRHNSYISIW